MPKLVWKPGTLLGPLPPVLVSCGTIEHPNVFTVAWTGIVNTTPAMTYISVRPERYSYSLIREYGAFALNLTTRNLVRAADFCGVRSGRDLNKWESCGLTPEPGAKTAAPLVAESPLSLECKVKQVIPLGSHDLFLAEIAAVDVDERLIDRHGKLRLDKAELAAFAHGTYYELGKQLGTFGFSVRKKSAKPTRKKKKT